MLIKPLSQNFGRVFWEIASSFPLVMSNGGTISVKSAGMESIFFRGSKNAVGSVVSVLAFRSRDSQMSWMWSWIWMYFGCMRMW